MKSYRYTYTFQYHNLDCGNSKWVKPKNILVVVGKTQIIFLMVIQQLAIMVTVLSVSSSTQTFLNESSDIEVEVTDMVNMYYRSKEIWNVNQNYGSQETDETTFVI